MEGLLLDSTTPPAAQWALIALGVVTILYIGFVRPLRKGKRKDPLERTPTQAGLAQQRAVEREMSSLLVEYEELLRRMSAHLDTRAAKLELLIREADETLARLEAARAADTATGALPPPGQAADPDADADAATPAPAADARHTDVYELADRGQSARQIARELNRPYGEVELILALRGAKP